MSFSGNWGANLAEFGSHNPSSSIPHKGSMWVSELVYKEGQTLILIFIIEIFRPCLTKSI